MASVNNNEQNQAAAMELDQPPQQPQQIYHEKQAWCYCAIHTVNNVLQEERYSKAAFDAICEQLTPGSWFSFNPHRSMIGLGNFDVNVITVALQKCDKELIWFHANMDPEHDLNLANIYGFILNIPATWKIGEWLDFNHWVAVKQINGEYYNLDSKEQAPVIIGKEAEFLAYLRRHLEQPKVHLFLVVEKDIADSNTWRKAQEVQAQAQDANSGQAQDDNSGQAQDNDNSGQSQIDAS